MLVITLLTCIVSLKKKGIRSEYLRSDTVCFFRSMLILCDRYILTYEAVERAVDLCIFMSDEPLVDSC